MQSQGATGLQHANARRDELYNRARACGRGRSGHLQHANARRDELFNEEKIAMSMDATHSPEREPRDELAAHARAWSMRERGGSASDHPGEAHGTCGRRRGRLPTASMIQGETALPSHPRIIKGY